MISPIVGQSPPCLATPRTAPAVLATCWLSTAIQRLVDGFGARALGALQRRWRGQATRCAANRGRPPPRGAGCRVL